MEIVLRFCSEFSRDTLLGKIYTGLVWLCKEIFGIYNYFRTKDEVNTDLMQCLVALTGAQVIVVTD